MPRNTVPEYLSPYSVTLEDGIYRFTTSQNREYSCTFSILNDYFPPVIGVYGIEIYLFEFFCGDSKSQIKKGKDKRVYATIMHLLSEFFIKNDSRLIIFICDNSDGRGKHRKALFKKWNGEVLEEFDWESIEFEVIGSETIHGAILRRMDFPNHEVLRSEVIGSLEGLMTEKYGQ